MYIDMSSYKKLYNVSKEHGLPEIVFLDKGNSFSFTVFLSSHGDTSEFSTNAGLWAGPTWQPRVGPGASGGVGSRLQAPPTSPDRLWLPER